MYDRDALLEAVVLFRPDIVLDELTDLPDRAADLREHVERNARIRTAGNRNVVDAARASGARRLLAQSVAWRLPPGSIGPPSGPSSSWTRPPGSRSSPTMRPDIAR